MMKTTNLSTVSKMNQKSKQLGQGMTEYIIIVALIAIAAIGVYSLFGETLRSQVSGLSHELSGQEAAANIVAAKASAVSSKPIAETKIQLGNFDETATKANK